MPSADLYTPVAAFLGGDSGDIFAAVNGEAPGVMVSGSVVVTRSNRGEMTRQRNPFPLMVEIIRVPQPPPSRAVGMGWRERDIVLDLAIALRQKDITGANQRVTLEQVMRALVFRYSGMTGLAITVSAGSATFRRSSAEVVSADDVTDSAEFARAVVRVVFTFTEEMASNL